MSGHGRVPRHREAPALRGGSTGRAPGPGRRGVVAAGALAVLGLTAPEPRALRAGTARTGAEVVRDAADLQPATHWTELFDDDWAATRARSRELSRSADSWDHYELAYAVDALTAACRASGRTRHAEDALALVEAVISSAVPSWSLAGSQYRDAHLGWASQRDDVRGEEVPLFESYFWRYAVAAAAVAAQHPELAGRARRVTAFAERHVLAKWWTRGPEGTVLRERTHMTAHWGLIALVLRSSSHQRGTGRRCRHLLEELGSPLPWAEQSLRRQMQLQQGPRGALFWSDVWGAADPPGQDVAHGNGVVSFVVEAADREGGWAADAATGLVATLAHVVWPRTGTGASYVDGSGTGTGWFADGFVKLGRRDVALQRRLEQHEPANGQHLANLALNAALLGVGDQEPAR